MQTDLRSIIRAEFPRKMVRKVRQEKVASSTIIVGEFERTTCTFNEVRICFVTSSPQSLIEKDPWVYLDGFILYYYVEEQVGKSLIGSMADSLDLLIKALIKDITCGNWILCENPMSLVLRHK